MYKNILLFATLALVSMPLLAADYFVVVPSAEKAKVVAAIEVTLNGAQLPAGTLDQAYSGFDLNTALRVSGDPAYDSALVSWRVTSGSLPAGITLSPAGILSGVPSSVGSSNVVVRAIYKTKAGEQSYQFVVRYAYDAETGVIVSLSAGRQEIIAGDGTPILLTASVEDGGAVPASDGEVVTWSASKGTLGGAQSITQAGQAQTTFVAPTVAGAHTITAKLGSTGTTKTTSVSVVPDMASAKVTSLVASPSSIKAGGASQSVLTATIQDAYGNSLGAGIDVTWSATLGTLSAASSTTDTAGKTSVVLTSAATGGTATVTSALGE